MRADVKDSSAWAKLALLQCGNLGKVPPVVVVPTLGQGVREVNSEATAAVGVFNHSRRESPNQTPDTPRAEPACHSRRQQPQQPMFDPTQHSHLCGLTRD